MRRRPPVSLVLLALATAGAPRAGAQLAPGTPPVAADTLPYIGAEWEDRLRLRQLAGEAPTAGWLARAPSARLALRPSGDSTVVTPILPDLLLVRNSALPFSQNDGLLWAGRGTSLRLRGGLTAARGRLRAVLVPELALSGNQGFVDVDVSRWYRPPVDTARSPYASPWNQHPVSADVPVKFGMGGYTQLSLGQSALWWEGDAVAAGVATENLWWGPGLRDALLMTNHAAGVPHLFLRTARPWRTRVGSFEGRWIVGALSESQYFDRDPANDTRSLSAAVLVYTPPGQANLSLGVARAVYAPTGGALAALGHAFDVLGAFERPAARPLGDTTLTGGRDQLASLFARLVLPRAGWEFWAELGRAERPASLRDFLEDPGHSGASIVGAQHVRPVGGGGRLRLQLELAQLEQSSSYRYRPAPSWYTSRATPQGYTQRGQVIGAGIGPGSSHQWFAADYVAPSWSAGAAVGRWRFNTDAMYATINFPRGTGRCELDTTIYPSVRGAHRSARLGLVQAELAFGTRINAFHQNNSGCPVPEENRSLRDVRNRTLRLTVAPRLRF